jgi:hypothetical protein
MSSKASAKIEKMDIDDLVGEIEVETELDLLEPALFIGEPLDGGYPFIVVHECPFCHAKMQTIGVGHGVYHCSWCAAKRSRNIEMKRRYEALEVLE